MWELGKEAERGEDARIRDGAFFWGLGFGAWGLGFRTESLGLGFRIESKGQDDEDVGFRVWGLGLGFKL